MREGVHDDEWFEIFVPTGVYPATRVAIRNPYAASTTIYRLEEEAVAWLNENCAGSFKERYGNTYISLKFTNKRDAVLFWTFYA